MATKIADKDKPWVANYPPLKEWLDKHGAFCQWQKYDEKWASVECWQVGKGQAILIIFAGGVGWNIYTADLGNDLQRSLMDAETRLGLVAPASPDGLIKRLEEGRAKQKRDRGER